MCRSTATRRFTAGPRWRTARIPAARSGWRLSCAIAKGVGNHDRLASRSAHPLHRTRVVAAGRGHEPRPLPGPLTERSDLMTQKICFDCFHKLFPDKPIRKITLGRQCVVCKAQTDRTEQMIPVEAEDIPLVKQIAQVPRRVLHRTERHADRRVAVRVAARGAGQVGRDAGQAGRALDSPCRVCQIGIGSRDGRSTLASGHRSAGEGEPSPGAGDPRVTPLRSS